MKMKNWQKCIVTLLDMVGVKSLSPQGKASTLMRKMHKIAYEKINTSLSPQFHGYIWNDAILLLCDLSDKTKTKYDVMAEISAFKEELEKELPKGFYGISVIGRAFPNRELDSANRKCPSRAVILRTSSWAMANCFYIEEELKKHKADWYIDNRITRNSKHFPIPYAVESLKLLPKNTPRDIIMFKGKIH